MASKNYWLMKSEPDEFSIEDLKKKTEELWIGVRNYQARNFMTKSMMIGDEVLFYHSNAKPSGIAGLAVVSGLAQVDPLQFDKKSEYFDKRATHEKPIWYCVKIKYKKTFPKIFSLEEIKKDKALSKMLVVKRGMRLSIQPVDKKDYEHILSVVGG